MPESLVNPAVAPQAPASVPVEPINPPPAEEPVAPEATEAPNTELSDEVLQIPAMQALMAGQPAAVSASIADMSQRPEGQAIADNKDAIMKAGIGLYRSLDGVLAVLFNQFYINGEEIKQADVNGELLKVAPPMDEVNAKLSTSPEGNPVLNARGPEGGFREAPAPTAPSMSSVAPMTPQGPSQAARAGNVNMGSPTSGPRPGAGRLLNSILKPVI